MITQEQKELLESLIDMDSWKHSWHVNIYDADQKSINNKIKEIISEKMVKRTNELYKLYDGYELLKSLDLKEDDINENNDNSSDDLPF